MTALHYELSGDPGAPPLLLAGSLGTNLAMWDPQLVLGDRFRLIRIDHRGHGQSATPPGAYAIADMAQDVVELLDHLDLPAVAFAGVSIGGMVGLWLAAVEPRRLTGLVAMCTAAHVPNGGAFRERAAAVRAAGGTEGIADGVVDRWLTSSFAASHPEARAKLRQMLTSTDAIGYAGCCEAVAGFDMRAELTRISAPTLVISGAQDSALPVSLQAEIVSAIPRAEHEILDPGAHILSAERSDAVNQLIGAHLT